MKSVSYILCLLATLFCLSVKADEQLLWWLVEGTDTVEDWYGTETTVAATGANAARIRVDDAATGNVITYLDFYVKEGNATSELWTGDDGWGIPAEAFAVVDNYTSAAYSFAVELGNAVNEVWVKTLAASEALPYTSAVQHIGTWSGIASEMATKWKPSGYSVPEPSSGLLMLLGGALLALRRRRGT